MEPPSKNNQEDASSYSYSSENSIGTELALCHERWKKQDLKKKKKKKKNKNKKTAAAPGAAAAAAADTRTTASTPVNTTMMDPPPPSLGQTAAPTAAGATPSTVTPYNPVPFLFNQAFPGFSSQYFAMSSPMAASTTAAEAPPGGLFSMPSATAGTTSTHPKKVKKAATSQGSAVPKNASRNYAPCEYDLLLELADEIIPSNKTELVQLSNEFNKRSTRSNVLRDWTSLKRKLDQLVKTTGESGETTQNDYVKKAKEIAIKIFNKNAIESTVPSMARGDDNENDENHNNRKKKRVNQPNKTERETEKFHKTMAELIKTTMAGFSASTEQPSTAQESQNAEDIAELKVRFSDVANQQAQTNQMMADNNKMSNDKLEEIMTLLRKKKEED
jgi:hypothetical protein